jgi:hypothetical protein
MNAVSEKTSAMRMRYSELHSNVERMAEMTIPPSNRSLSNRLACFGTLQDARSTKGSASPMTCGFKT